MNWNDIPEEGVCNVTGIFERLGSVVISRSTELVSHCRGPTHAFEKDNGKLTLSYYYDWQSFAPPALPHQRCPSPNPTKL